MPSGPIECAGAPQKIASLAADHWREQGVLDGIPVVLVLPAPGMFGVKVLADELERVVAGDGIEVRRNSELTAVDPVAQEVVITDDLAGTHETLHYDMLHTAPPQSPPDRLRATPLSGPEHPADRHPRERRDMWLLKRYGLPFLYWHVILSGRT